MTKKEMIQAMLDGRSFEYVSGESSIYFNGEAFMVKLNDGTHHPFNVNNLFYKCYKSIHTWEDDVCKSNPVLCWVSDVDPSVRKRVIYINKIVANGKHKAYGWGMGPTWKYATPVKPSDCWSSQ